MLGNGVEVMLTKNDCSLVADDNDDADDDNDNDDDDGSDPSTGANGAP